MIITNRNERVPVITVNQELLLNKDPISQGQEGDIYDYYCPQTKEEYALKVLCPRSSNQLKYQKIAFLSHYADPNYCFPLGFFIYQDDVPNLFNEYEGTFMRLLKTKKDFSSLREKDLLTKLSISAKGDCAIKRGHDAGLTLGDIKSSNILIEGDNPIFVDTDNIACPGFNYNLYPTRASWLQQIYGGKYSQKDNDIFLYSYLVLQVLADGEKFPWPLYPQAFRIIDLLNIPMDLKNDLKRIFSDSFEKPYMSPVLMEMIDIFENDPERPLLTRKLY